MSGNLHLIPPLIVPPLDDQFRPAALANRYFHQQVRACGIPLVIGLERCNHQISRYETWIYPPDHPAWEANLEYVERMVKFLLWQRGGYRVFIGAPAALGKAIRKIYSPKGKRRFDEHFMGRQVYQEKFEVVSCRAEEVPPACETGIPLGRNLGGCRVGFDLGASDYKVSAVVDGQVVYSEEVVWEPRKQPDPDYYYREIMTAIQSAASKMPRLDAVGGSSAGIYIGNRPMVASLFRNVPPERYQEITNLFLHMRDELGVPLEVINDGDVTALAGSMSIDDNGILGIALGSSEAAGYVNMQGHVMGWLNELAFAPVDYNPAAVVEEWSGDRGCGASYLSQQCVFRLANLVGMSIPSDISDVDKLKLIQRKLDENDSGAAQIWETMGIYLGYGLAHYAEFYDIKHVLILGRCTSGRGGELLLTYAKKVLDLEFPEISQKIKLHLPDEKTRRIGQSVAAASLPVLGKENREISSPHS